MDMLKIWTQVPIPLWQALYCLSHLQCTWSTLYRTSRLTLSKAEGKKHYLYFTFQMKQFTTNRGFSMIKLEPVLTWLSSSRTKLLIPCLKIYHLPLWGQPSTEGVLWPEIFPECPFLKQCHITMWKPCRGAWSWRVLLQLGSICYSFLKTNGILMQCSVERSKIMWNQRCFPHWARLSPPAAASGAFQKSLFCTPSW